MLLNNLLTRLLRKTVERVMDEFHSLPSNQKKHDIRYIYMRIDCIAIL